MLKQCLLSLGLASVAAVGAAAQGVRGYWSEPAGSVIHIQECGADLCLTLVSISPQAPARIDGLNPDPALRSRTLCGVQIGTGFHPSADGKADGGQLYDPKSGKTYHGSLKVEGDRLHLRGFVGVRLFGRTETWSRSGPVPVCTR